MPGERMHISVMFGNRYCIGMQLKEYKIHSTINHKEQ